MPASPFTINSAGVYTPDLTHSDMPGQVKMYSAHTIHVGGVEIGTIKSIDFDGLMTQQTHEHRVLGRHTGRIVAAVTPGQVGASVVTGSILHLWNGEAHRAFGLASGRIAHLGAQTSPVDMRVAIYRDSQVYEVWSYRTGWFENLKKAEFSSEGDFVVQGTFGIKFVGRVDRTV